MSSRPQYGSSLYDEEESDEEPEDEKTVLDQSIIAILRNTIRVYTQCTHHSSSHDWENCWMEHFLLALGLPPIAATIIRTLNSMANLIIIQNLQLPRPS